MGAGHSSSSRGDSAGASPPPAQAQAASLPPAEKLGAGLLLTCDGEVLLLRRAGKHNFGTWGLPGGNADPGDADLLATARREAEEEMGPGVPPFEVLTQVLTTRGKRGQKHYTVFVARIGPEDRASWQPQLNEEHSDWRWFRVAELQAANPPLHPVVALALQASPHREAVLAAIAGGAGKP
ncbi:hypothetical protein ABPG75_013481 [Micractinium tetrahymenae]